MEFRTERLDFREFDSGDFALFHALYSDPAVMRYAYRDRFATEREALKAFEDMLRHNAEQTDHRAYTYAVFSKATGEFLGGGDIEIQLHHEHGGIGEIGYFLLPAHWGCGYAAEIAGKLLEICFDTLGLHKAVASCNANNAASEHVMRKIGMEREGLFRQVRWKNGRWDDELRYAILAEDWRKAR